MTITKLALLPILLGAFYSTFTDAKTKEEDYQLKFRGVVSEMAYIKTYGSTLIHKFNLKDGTKPFTIYDGYCSLNAISHDMDKEQLKRKKVHPNHRSPFMYGVGYDQKTEQWRITVTGGAPGSFVGARCFKFK